MYTLFKCHRSRDGRRRCRRHFNPRRRHCCSPRRAAADAVTLRLRTTYTNTAIISYRICARSCLAIKLKSSQLGSILATFYPSKMLLKPDYAPPFWITSFPVSSKVVYIHIDCIIGVWRRPSSGVRVTR